MKRSAHVFFMSKAIEAARKSISIGQTPFGACIVKNDKIIVRAHNRVWADTDITAHAEVVAIRKACLKLNTIDLSETVLYSTCEPCPMCFSAAHWANIPLIVYGASIKDAKRLGFNELSISNQKMKTFGKSKVRILKGVMAKENRELFYQWKKKSANKLY